MKTVCGLSHPMNRNVLAYCRKGGRTAFGLVPAARLLGLLERRMRGIRPWVGLPRRDDVRLRTSQEVQARMWNLSGAVPAGCRCAIYGFPALAHPQTHIIFALGARVGYFLRLPQPLVAEVHGVGALSPQSVLESGDLLRALDNNWIEGRWSVLEFEWCRVAYEAFGGSREEAAAPGGRILATQSYSAGMPVDEPGKSRSTADKRG